jgi:hypothetical protein
MSPTKSERNSLPWVSRAVSSRYYTGFLRRTDESGSARWLSGQGEEVSTSNPFTESAMSRPADQDRKVAKVSERIQVTVAEKIEPEGELGLPSDMRAKGGFLGSLKQRTTKEKDDEEAQGC